MTVQKGNKEVLVVDDDLIVRDFLTRFLSKQGFVVKLVMSGQAAIEVLKEKNFDIVFLDIRMPFVDGITVYNQIKNKNPQLKFVLMSGYAVEDSLKDILGQKNVFYIKKPFDIEELEEIIKQLK